ncbi:MAG: polymerase sigma factor, sigma-70 family [Phycisphaerales bacterium]|nr:polymerase sigma factor, sigma-70 family [Phycisphaerales bacterium]
MRTGRKIQGVFVLLLALLLLGGSGMAIVQHRARAPMAGATPVAVADVNVQPDPPLTVPLDPKGVARLADGFSIEVIGLGEYPSAGKNWWAANGAPLTAEPYPQFSGVAHPWKTELPLKRQFALRVLPPADVADVMPSAPPGGSVAMDVSDRLGHLIPGMIAGVTPMPAQPFNLRLAVATGPWSIDLRSDGARPTEADVQGGHAGIGTLTASAPSDGPPATQVILSLHTERGSPLRERRIVFGDAQGQDHPTRQVNLNGTPTTAFYTYQADGLSPTDVKTIRLETRPFDQSIEFHDLAVYAGQTTSPSVISGNNAKPF